MITNLQSPPGSHCQHFQAPTPEVSSKSSLKYVKAQNGPTYISKLSNHGRVGGLYAPEGPDAQLGVGHRVLIFLCLSISSFTVCSQSDSSSSSMDIWHACSRSYDDRTSGSYHSLFSRYQSMNSETPSEIVYEGSYPINSAAFDVSACV